MKINGCLGCEFCHKAGGKDQKAAGAEEVKKFAAAL